MEEPGGLGGSVQKVIGTGGGPGSCLVGAEPESWKMKRVLEIGCTTV